MQGSNSCNQTQHAPHRGPLTRIQATAWACRPVDRPAGICRRSQARGGMRVRLEAACTGRMREPDTPRRRAVRAASLPSQVSRLSLLPSQVPPLRFRVKSAASLEVPPLRFRVESAACPPLTRGEAARRVSCLSAPLRRFAAPSLRLMHAREHSLRRRGPLPCKKSGPEPTRAGPGRTWLMGIQLAGPT
jgi:hypothetical protein